MWGIERKIVPLILNGSEAWHQFNTSGSKSFGAADFDSRIKIDSALLCDRLSEDVTNNVWIGKRDNTIATSGSSTRYIRIFLNSTATLDTLKALLSAEPMHVIAERKSPAWEPLPADTQSALNALTTYTGTTHVTVTAGGPEPDVGLEYFGQPGDKVTVQDMCDSFAAPGFDDSGVVEEITSFQSFYDKFVSGMKIRDFFRNLKAGLKFVLHTGQLVNNGLCNEPGKYPLDAAYGRTLLEMIGNTANLPGGAADIVSAIVTQNSNLPYIDTSKKIKDGFANGTSWAATEDCIVCGSIGFNISAQGCNVLINGINIFWVNNDVTVNSSMPIWFSVRKGDTVRFIGYNSQVPNLTNLYAFSTK